MWRQLSYSCIFTKVVESIYSDSGGKEQFPCSVEQFRGMCKLSFYFVNSSQQQFKNMRVQHIYFLNINISGWMIDFYGGWCGGFGNEYPVGKLIPKKFMYMTTPEKKNSYMFSEAKKHVTVH